MQVAFIMSPAYPFWESNRVIVKELVTNLGLSLVGVTLISLLLLIHPLAVLLVIFTVISVNLCLVLEMWVLDIKINTISVVNLVMAVGARSAFSLFQEVPCMCVG